MAAVLVTGAASGIGAAIARRTAGGADVLAVDLDVDGLDKLAASTSGIQPVPADLSDLDAADALPAEVDVLVNSAGLQHVANPVSRP